MFYNVKNAVRTQSKGIITKDEPKSVKGYTTEMIYWYPQDRETYVQDVTQTIAGELAVCH